jgi:hypothetical protein
VTRLNSQDGGSSGLHGENVELRVHSFIVPVRLHNSRGNLAFGWTQRRRCRPRHLSEDIR